MNQITNDSVAAAPVVAPDPDRPRRSQLKLFLDAFFANRLAVIGLVLVALALATAIGADVIAPYDPDQQSLNDRLQGPSAVHWLGTDQYGRDLLSRIIFGARISLTVGIVSVVFATVIGVFFGAIAGYVGGILDDVIMRIMDIMLAFPALILAIGILAVLGPSVGNVIAVIAVVSIPQIARVTRGRC